MATATKSTLGIGLYTPAEAAFYARVRTQTMNRWLFGDKRNARVLATQVEGDGEKVVTFLDFVQALAIRAIRSKHKIPLEKIRQAVDLARSEYGIQYPFAVDHTTYLFSDEQDEGHGEIVLKIGDKLVQASGVSRKNLILREVAELYIRDLKFDPETSLAQEYTAWKGEHGRIVMNPHIRFGEPVVERCGYSAQTLWEAYEIEGGIKNAAESYLVDEADVELALSYFDHLLSSSAA
ncbi:MAG: hypothetical protein HYS13_13240 [Planctomycetia bacterium]|nr:hypothetical protein [Planctomycetia bacterium]